MFERFTDRARRVVVLAQEEARMLNHNYIGTEHLLLGLAHEGEGVAAKTLESLGISLATIRQQVEEIIGKGVQAPAGHIPFTPRAKTVLELSLREALQLDHNYIGTEHILLGLIREGEGVAAQVLVRLGADLDRVRLRVIKLLEAYSAKEPSAAREGDPGPATSMFDRFTDRSRRVVVLAQEEARMLNHNYIGTEHILLGLIHEGDGVAARALESLGISLEAVRQQVEAIIGQGAQTPTGHLPFTPRARKVLELSLREATELGHGYIGTEHILLGLIREGEGVAAQVLVRLGADLSRVRLQVILFLHGPERPGQAQPVQLDNQTTVEAEPTWTSRVAATDEGLSRYG
jgi:ATP-dependent Clp protease ATP-binding subunit ClpA